MPSNKSPSSSELVAEIERTTAQRIAALRQADTDPKPGTPSAGRAPAARPIGISERLAERNRREGHLPLGLDDKSKTSISERVRSAQRHAGEPVKGGRK